MADSIRIRFLNNIGEGFAQYFNVTAGTTIAQFLAERGISQTNMSITVNREIVTPDYQLRADDRVCVTPAKVAGAGEVRIRFLNNIGEGFAQYFNVSEGTTIAQFLSARGISQSNMSITVNREIVTPDYQLRADDRVCVTPAKVAGAAIRVVSPKGEMLFPDSRSVYQLFMDVMGNEDPRKFVIRVNGDVATIDEWPSSDAVVSIAPVAPTAFAAAPAPAAPQSTKRMFTVKFPVEQHSVLRGTVEVNVEASNADEAAILARDIVEDEYTSDDIEVDEDISSDPEPQLRVTGNATVSFSL